MKNVPRVHLFEKILQTTLTKGKTVMRDRVSSWWGACSSPSATVHHHADGAGKDCAADVLNSLHLLGLP